MKAKIFALLLCLLPSLAMAQSAPAKLPAQSVYGRLGVPGDTGPGQAIPFATLLGQLLGGAQSANTVYAGPSSGSAATASFRALVGADLPAPGSTSFGGVKSSTCASSNWFNTLSTSGVFGCTQPNFTDLAGSIAGSQIPTGTITSAMILDGTILNADISASAAIALSKLAAQNTKTIVGNSTGGSAVPTALTGDQVGAILCAPSRSVFTSGTNTTYTTPTCNSALPTRIEIEMVGGGGGSSGSGTSPGGTQTAGGNSCWNTSSPACTTPLFAANGGAFGSVTATNIAAGGTASGCDLNLTGGSGGETIGNTSQAGGAGGSSFFGGNGPSVGFGSGPAAAAGIAGIPNTGGGASGASSGSAANNGGGGAAGGYCRKIITSPSSSYFYTVGVGGTAGGAGTSGAAGAAGGSGLIIATAYWQ